MPYQITKLRLAMILSTAVALVVVAVVPDTIVMQVSAQQPAVQPPQPAQPGGAPPAGRGGAAQPPLAPPVAYEDYTGYTRLWDGSTLTNWEGETDVWSIQNGMIHADTTKTPGQHHLHYIGPGAVMRDFDLKVEFKLSARGANGGIQYRSRLLHAAHGGSIDDPLGAKLPAGITTLAQAIEAGITRPQPPRGGGAAPAPTAGGVPGRGAAPAVAPTPTPAPVAAGGVVGVGNPWQVSGYQFDINSPNTYTGALYEGQGRGFIAPNGSVVQALPGRRGIRLGTVVENPASIIKPHLGLDGEWNQIHIIARGKTLVHMINGRVMTVGIDDDPGVRAYQGIMSLQLEGMGQIWYRNIYVKHADSDR